MHEAAHYNSRRLFFVSREGIFLKKLFDRYQKSLFGKELYQTTYFRASRKATFLPSLGELGTETFEVLFRQYRKLSIEKFVSNLNLKKCLGEELSQIFGSDFTKMEEDLPSSPNFKKLLNLQIFQVNYEEERLKQKAALSHYLTDLGCVDKDVLLVDVGWKGSIQDNLRKLLPGNQRLIGLYLGLSINTSTPLSIKRGLLFDSPSINSPAFCFSKFLPIYEILCAAREGSTSTYELVNQKTTTIMEDDEIERKIFSQIIGPAQNALYKIFESASEALLDHHFDNFANLFKSISKHHSRLLYLPTKMERDFLRKIDHLENFGVLNYTKFEAPPVSAAASIMNLAKLLTAPNRTLGNGSNPLLTCSNLGLGWLQGAVGLTLISKTFGDTSGLNAPPPSSFSKALCLAFRVAERAKTLGDYR
jgi:hypothetical protein